MNEPLQASLQEAVLAVLAFDDRFGSVVAAQVTPENFDGIYNEIATSVLAYRRRYNKPPGRTHLESIFSRAKIDPGNSKTHALRRTLVNLAAQAEGVNAEYVTSRVQDFVRSQRLSVALLEANERYLQGGDEAVTEVENILNGALRFRQTTLDAGTFLNNTDRAFEFLSKQEEFYSLGIPQLDKIGVGPVAKQLLLYIGPKGCLVGETLVDCPRDLRKYPKGVPIKDLVGKQFLTYSWDFNNNTMGLSKVLAVWSTGQKPVYRVRLSAFPNGATAVGSRVGGVQKGKFLPPLELVGTYDHPVLLCDGTWRRLGDLVTGDSLKSLYRRVAATGEDCLLSWSGDTRPDQVCWGKTVGLATYYALVRGVTEHQFVCAAVNGPQPSGTETHHRDKNHYNNAPENLEWKGIQAHRSDHLRERNLEGTTGWVITGVHPRGMAGKRHTTETKNIQRKASEKATAAAKLRDPEEMRRRGRLGGRPRSPNHKVISVEYVGIQETYDMEVEGTSNFVANGVFVHNSGKSWFSVHVGKQCLLQKAKVLHISLEMEEPLVQARYFQSFFGVARYPKTFYKSVLELDDLERLTGFRQRKVLPKSTSKPREDDDGFISYQDPGIRKILRAKIRQWNTRFNRLVIKDFPSGTLTIAQLRGYLDYLELTHKFIPNVLIVDYVDLMRMDKDNLRISTGSTFVELRGLAAERNLAVIAPTQSNRSGIKAKRVSSTNASEDISKVFTADTVLSYSQTEAEQQLGLARLTVEHARNTETGSQVLLTQSYATGQYVLESAALQNAYWERLKAVSGEGEEE